MKDSKKASMRGFPMPKQEMEKAQGKLGATSQLKYAAEFGNPGDLDKNSKGLADYVKKNKMKY